MYLNQSEDFQKHMQLNEDGQFYVAYKNYLFQSVFQPICFANKEIFAFEGLVRIEDKQGNRIRPDVFFRSPELTFVDAVNISLLCGSLHMRNFAQSVHKTKKLFINTPPTVFQVVSHDKTAVNALLSLISRLGMSAEQMVYEILEFDEGDMQVILSGINILKQHGISIAMDDYGMNGSNKSRAEALRPSIIKLDKSLLENYINHQSEELETSIKLCRDLGAKIILEGLETQEQLQKVSHLGIDMYQGYLLGHPQPLATMANGITA